MRVPSLLMLLMLAFVTPASAQFYEHKTITFLINYGAGGNADLEARVFQQFLPKYIPGAPQIILQFAPGAGGINGMNMLGMNIGSRADGLTMGYFTFGPISTIAEDPALKINVADFVVIGATKSFALAYGRKDMPPGIEKPADLAKATKVFAGGYARSSLHDTRLRFALELLGVPYQMVTGFQTIGAINKAMVQNELNFSSSTLPGWTTQVIPQVVNTGIGIPLFQFPVMGKNGEPVGFPPLDRAGIPTFDAVYKEVFGKPPSGPKWEALLLANHLGTQMQRLMVLPKGSPPEARDALRKGIIAVSKDPEFIAAFHKVTNEDPLINPAEDVEPLLKQMYEVSPEVKKVVKESILEQ
jgi:tripartite-type tricarboxylate transporter receptor subunit TctC